jgi:antagonist of KipI
MSIRVIKAGIADSIQDNGRVGFQHLGINTNGAMDINAMKIANALVGNELDEAVLEMSFPSAVLLFTVPALMAISGADFTARLNGKAIPLHQPVVVAAGSELRFTKVINGAWCYLALQGGFEMKRWLGSNSTNAKANAGGFAGRFLKMGDEIPLRETVKETTTKVLPWRANVAEFYESGREISAVQIQCMKGNEFEWLTKQSQKDFVKQLYVVNRHSDRMGSRLTGKTLKQSKKQEMVSTAVTFGTLQLLPNGELISLMADHQTTGGYPRLAHVCSAERSRIVQCRPGDKLLFSFIGIQEAEALLLHQEKSIRQLRWSCMLKLKESDLW